MSGTGFWFLGCIINVAIAVRKIYKDGKLVTRDTMVFFMFIAFSWIATIIYAASKIAIFLETHFDGNKVLWRRKNNNKTK